MILPWQYIQCKLQLSFLPRCGFRPCEPKPNFCSFLTLICRDVTNLNVQQLCGIIEFLPTVKESRALERYTAKENDGLLCECEKFMVSMLNVTDAQKKTQTMLFMLQFPVAINEIRSGELSSIERMLNLTCYCILLQYQHRHHLLQCNWTI